MQVTLFVRAPKKPEKRVVVDHDVVIGRGKDCNLRVLSNDVSRQHCRLVIGESEVAIRDLGSGNGTLLNNQETEPNTDAVLSSGDIVRIGPLIIKVEFHAVSTETLDAMPAEPAAVPDISPPAEVADTQSEPIEELAEWEPDLDDAADDEPPLDDAASLIETASDTEQILKPADDDELIADQPVADEFAEADPAELESAESVAAESLEAEQQPGRLKSLFGRFSRKKNRGETTEAKPELTEAESTADFDTADQEPSLVTGNVEIDQETVAVDQENTFPHEESDTELLHDDDEGLSDEGDYLDEEVEEKAVDPGFADFLNQVDQPPE